MKTKACCIVTLTLILLSAAGCFRNDIRTETFRVNSPFTIEDARRVSDALHAVPGVQDVRCDPAGQMLAVTYDALSTHLKNIEAEIVKAGFDLPNWPALD